MSVTFQRRSSNCQCNSSERWSHLSGVRSGVSTCIKSYQSEVYQLYAILFPLSNSTRYRERTKRYENVLFSGHAVYSLTNLENSKLLTTKKTRRMAA